jgi:hypothetical protein
LTTVCIGTGPSLTLAQIETAKRKGFRLFGCNNVWKITELELLYACNRQWWDYYWPEVKHCSASKWTTNKEAATVYGLNWIAERNEKGLSTDPSYVHHGHGSGYTLLNLAYLMGAKRIVLLGYDMKYAPDYDGSAMRVGSSPRHFFGEYPSQLQHWPKAKVKNGVHTELCELYQSVADQGLVEIVNATPDSALTCFPKADIDAI